MCTRIAECVLGRRVIRVLPSGATTRYAYDAANGLASVEHGGQTLTFERDALGRETSRSAAAGLTLASTYDANDRLIEQRASAPGLDGEAPRRLVERRYRYDRVGRVERVDDGRWGATTYAYDALDELLSARRGNAFEAFTYDPAGSIVAALEEIDGARRDAQCEVGPGNVLLAAGDAKYAYDKRGRRVVKVRRTGPDSAETTKYEWDGRDQLRGATLPDGARVAIAYDALGRRTRKTVTGRDRAARTTEYVWDGDVLAMQVDSVDGVRTFVHRPGSFVPLLQEERGRVFTSLLDQVGTVKALPPDGRVAWSAAHGAWGAVVAEDLHADERARSPFRLLGQIADDDLGLAFTRFRSFDAEVGRWVSPSLGDRRGAQPLRVRPFPDEGRGPVGAVSDGHRRPRPRQIRDIRGGRGGCDAKHQPHVDQREPRVRRVGPQELRRDVLLRPRDEGDDRLPPASRQGARRRRLVAHPRRHHAGLRQREFLRPHGRQGGVAALWRARIRGDAERSDQEV
jgi:YD repeat-containing protein